ncbi:hypothetical protein AURDEDRAFT_112522 [Auricularia subglabra TFB-10046 SS5]|nr:hypothetical protein AURDEDRAFT_112522 [Auricularia subglabra TFB-10046 SS5]
MYWPLLLLPCESVSGGRGVLNGCAPLQVQKAAVMLDPHTRESRGFGFVTMEVPEDADAAISGLVGTEFMGKTLSIEKARRGRARTPTPGRYYGPPKRDQYERPYDPRPYDSRYAGERRGGPGGYGGPDRGGYGGGRYDDRDRGRYEDRGRYDDRDRGRYDDRGGRNDDRGGRNDDRGPRYDDRPPRPRYDDRDRRYDDRRY